MTQLEYENRNLQGFEGDSFMKAKFEQIINDYKINLVIECGSYHGGTTMQLAKMCDGVIGIEINDTFFDITRKNTEELFNVTLYNDDTLHALPRIFCQPEVLASNILIFIDSHWYNLPLIKELELIKKAGIKPCIAIHDFFVPHNDELGYDSYGNKTICWELIEDSIKDIYGDEGFSIEYNSNSTANGAKRGVIYIFPKV